MMELAINNSSQTLSVSDAVFGREFSEDLVHQVVVAYRNAGRAGTKAQKTRSEVAGTTKKSKRQKGGGARHGALTRSEEHTSELQSRPHLVCRLLLEKKKRAAPCGCSRRRCA